MVQVGFGGHVAPAECECHRGQFVVHVYAVISGGKSEPIGAVEFPTEELAAEKMPEVVKDFAHKFLASVGMDPMLASKVTVTHGDEAVAAEQRVRNNNNPLLH